jgi:hypothetical protein
MKLRLTVSILACALIVGVGGVATSPGDSASAEGMKLAEDKSGARSRIRDDNVGGGDKPKPGGGGNASGRSSSGGSGKSGSGGSSTPQK